MEEKVKKFLDNKFVVGSPMTNEEIELAIKQLGKNEEVFTIDKMDKNYLAFLNKYGSIYGRGFTIVGPSVHTSNKVRYISGFQRGFEARCKDDQMKASHIKASWFIASVDQGDDYYINLSRKNKNYVYSVNLEGRSKIFANDFLDFLDKFFEAYERQREEESYEEDIYEDENEED